MAARSVELLSAAVQVGCPQAPPRLVRQPARVSALHAGLKAAASLRDLRRADGQLVAIYRQRAPLPCRSNYWITRSAARWLPPVTTRDQKAAASRDARDMQAEHARNARWWRPPGASHAEPLAAREPSETPIRGTIWPGMPDDRGVCMSANLCRGQTRAQSASSPSTQRRR